MRFLIDENLPVALARMLNRHSRFPVEHVFDYREPGEPDLGIKPLAIELSLVVVTRDTTFVPSNTWQRTYLDEHVSAVILAARLSRADRSQLEEWLREHWSRVENIFAEASNPTVVRAYANGRFEVEEGETNA